MKSTHLVKAFTNWGAEEESFKQNGIPLTIKYYHLSGAAKWLVKEQGSSLNIISFCLTQPFLILLYYNIRCCSKKLPAGLGTSGIPAVSIWELFRCTWELNKHSQVHRAILYHGKIGSLLKSAWGGVSKSCDCKFSIECNKKRATETNILPSAAALRSIWDRSYCFQSWVILLQKFKY